MTILIFACYNLFHISETIIETKNITSWPWMKDINVVIAPPIEPVTEKNDRLSVLELIKKHRETIDEKNHAFKQIYYIIF